LFVFWEFFFFGGFFKLFFFGSEDKKSELLQKYILFWVITKICLCGSWTLNLGGLRVPKFEGGIFFCLLRGGLNFDRKM